MTDPNILSLAVIRFLGYGVATHPDENSARLVEEFGTETASKLEPEVRALLDELNNLKPDWSAHSSVTAGAQAKEKMRRSHPDISEDDLNTLDWVLLASCDWVKEEMRRSHPYLSEDALNALVWAFSWWWR